MSTEQKSNETSDPAKKTPVLIVGTAQANWRRTSDAEKVAQREAQSIQEQYASPHPMIATWRPNR